MRLHAKLSEGTLRILWLGMVILPNLLWVACASVESAPKPNVAEWDGVSVEALDSHTFFKTMPMFRTKTASGTEIRNYAYGYDFRECFGKAGADKFGDVVDGEVFITCSSSTIVCNNFFYIKEETILEYAPTGRCLLKRNVLPEGSILNSKGT